MEREQLELLIQRMNTPYEPEFHGNVGTTTWIAHREAEKLSDKSLLPLLEEIIHANQGEEQDKKDIRSAAYFIYEKILANTTDIDENGIAFLLRQMRAETDEWVFKRMLDQFWNIKISPDTELTPVIEYVESSHDQRALLAVKDFAEQGNKAAIKAYPMLEECVDQARKTPEEAILDIVIAFGINNEDDLERLDDEEGAALYETLKAGVMEEYDMSWEEVCGMLDNVF